MKLLSTLMAASMLFWVGCASKSKKEEKPVAVVGVGKTKTQADGKKRAEVTLKASAEGVTTCKSGNEVRTLEVVKDDNGCKTIYNKGGTETEAASGKASGEYCQSILEKIKGNLENAGYTCQ